MNEDHADQAQTRELSLEEQKKAWSAQIDHLIQRGYHAALGMTEEEYRATMPEFTPQPTEFRGRFDIFLLVDPRLSLEVQLRLMGIENDLDNEDPDLVVENIESVVTSSTPYQLWIQLGEKYKGKTIDELLPLLEKNERGLTALEGIALYREHEDRFAKNRAPGARFSIGLAGSVDNNPQYKGSIPQILYWMDDFGRRGEPEMWTHGRSQPNTRGGWPTCGTNNE